MERKKHQLGKRSQAAFVQIMSQCLNENTRLNYRRCALCWKGHVSTWTPPEFYIPKKDILNIDNSHNCPRCCTGVKLHRKLLIFIYTQNWR